jgi:hypothetical protein
MIKNEKQPVIFHSPQARSKTSSILGFVRCMLHIKNTPKVLYLTFGVAFRPEAREFSLVSLITDTIPQSS